MMTIPKLYYVGLLAGLVSRIPGIDFGTMLYAFGLSEVLFRQNLKKSFQTFIFILLGFGTTQFLPLWKLEIFFYRYADFILSFLFGIVIYSAGLFWVKSKNLNLKSTLVKAMVLIIMGIMIKAYQAKLHFNFLPLVYFLQGFFTLIPGFDVEHSSLGGLYFLKIIFFNIGLAVSIILLRKTEYLKGDWSWVKVCLLLIALCDLWPWRAFQRYLYLGDGARWLNDFPVAPGFTLNEIVFSLFFCTLGMLCSWSVNKINSDNVQVTFV